MNKDAFAPIRPDCATCRFWDSYPNLDGTASKAGICRRYAPRSHNLNEALTWPETYSGDWCGEYSERLI